MLSKGVAGYFPGRYGVLGLNFQHRRVIVVARSGVVIIRDARPL